MPTVDFISYVPGPGTSLLAVFCLLLLPNPHFGPLLELRFIYVPGPGTVWLVFPNIDFPSRPKTQEGAFSLTQSIFGS